MTNKPPTHRVVLIAILFVLTATSAYSQDNQEDSTAAYNRGLQAYWNKDFALALQQFQISYQQQNRPLTAYLIGCSYYSQDKFAEAKPWLNTALKANPPIDQIYVNDSQGMLQYIESRLAPPPPPPPSSGGGIGISTSAITAAPTAPHVPPPPKPPSTKILRRLSVPVASLLRLPAPRLIYPAEGAVFNYYPRTLHLDWQPVDGAVSYCVETDYGYNNKWASEEEGVRSIVKGVRSTHYIFDFVGAQPGRWRVWAVDANEREGASSSWRTFTFLQ